MMKIWKVTAFGINFFPSQFWSVQSSPMDIVSISDRSKSLSRIRIFKNFKPQKFLRECLSQFKPCANPQRLGIERYSHSDESDTSTDQGTLQKSNFCTFLSYIINPQCCFQTRNFHIYCGRKNAPFSGFSNKMLITGASIRNFNP